jgi:hypothetical protein
VAVSILESAEPLDVINTYCCEVGAVRRWGDSLTISAFTVDLVSLRDQPGADAGSLTDTITINASSDASPIPEPSTLALLGLGLAGAVLTKRG